MATAQTLEPETVEIDFDRPWSEEVLPLNALRIDRAYQRDVKTTLVNTIGAAYDLALAGYIVVSRRANGRLYIIDGQQRTQGARKAGESEILARVFDGLDLRTEAQYYDKLNDTAPQNTYERFKAAYTAGDPSVLSIYNIVHSFGASIMGVDGKGDETIASIAALRWVFKQGHEWGLAKTLTTIQMAFGEVSRTTTPSAFLKAVFYVIDRHDDFDDQRLARRINETGMIALKQRAIAFTSNAPGATGYYLALLDSYNHRLSERKKLNPVFRRVVNESDQEVSA